MKVKKLKQKDYLRHISNSLDDMTCEIRENNRLLVDQVKVEQDKLKYEKETKDRVDISLKEYEQLKRDLEMYKSTAEHYEEIFDRLKVAKYIERAEPSTIVVSTMKDPIRLSTKVHIQFESKVFEQYYS